MAGLYQKYGSTLDGDAMGTNLFKGQQAVNSSFKEALTGIGDLLKTVEQGYVDDNTTKVQEYFKNNIKSAGPWADAPTTEDIKSQFGKLINAEAIDKTVASTRAKLQQDSEDVGSTDAGRIFAETRDFEKATMSYGDSLRKQGAPESVVNQKMKSFYQDNQFMPEMVKIGEANLVDAAVNDAFAQSRQSGGQFSIEDTGAEAIRTAPPKLQGKILQAMREREKAERNLSNEQALDIDFANSQADNYIKTETMQHEQLKAAAKSKYDSIEFSPESSVEAAKTFNGGSMGGLYDRMAKDATGTWFGRGLKEGQIPKAMQTLRQEIMDGRKISSDEADGILFRAYQDARRVGIGSDNVDLPKESFISAVGRYTSLYDQKKIAEAEYTTIQSAALERESELLRSKTELIHELRKGAGDSRIYGTNFDIKSTFENDPVFGQFVGPKLTNVADTSGGSGNPTEADIEAEMAKKKALEDKAAADALAQKQPTTVAESPDPATTFKNTLKAGPVQGNMAINASMPGFALDAVTGAVDKGTALLNKGITAATGLQFGDGGGTNIGTNFGSKILNKMTDSDGITQTLLKTLGAKKVGYPVETAAMDIPKVLELRKTSGIVNTKVNDAIVKTTVENGLPPGMLFTWALIESNGNPDTINKSSGAKGLFQFVPSSAKGYGIVGKETDPEAAAEATAKMAKDNAVELSNKGIEPTEINLYLAHQQGAAGLTAIYKSVQTGEPLSAIRKAGIKANLPNNLKHLADDPQVFLDYWNKRYSKIQARVNGES